MSRKVVIYTGLSTLVIRDDSKLLNEKSLGKLIRNILLNRGELSIDDDHMNRVSRIDDYIVIQQYGSLDNDQLTIIVKQLIIKLGIEFTISNELPYVTEHTLLKDHLPSVESHSKSIYGGGESDTLTIDTHVQSLSNAFNSYDGITTFSSCEGHNKIKSNNRIFYILYTADDLDSMNLFAYDLDRYVDELYLKYDFDDQLIDIKFTYSYGKWESIQKIYFEFRITYFDTLTKDVFSFADDLSKLLNN